MEFAVHKPDVPERFGNYIKIRPLGEGSFAQVFLVRHVQTQEEYACKVYSRESLKNAILLERFERELRVAEYLHHSKVVSTAGVVYTEDFIFLLMEHCNQGDLLHFINNKGALPEEIAYHIFKQITEGLSYIHDRGIAHRDIKPENILLDDSMNVKIADFGLCHEVKERQRLRTPCGSPLYAAPEVLDREEYDGKKCDIWSLGVVLYAMCTGFLPWTEGVTDSQIIGEIIAGVYDIPRFLSPDLRNLLKSLINKDPAKRPSLQEIRNHQWMKSMNAKVHGERTINSAFVQTQRRRTYGVLTFTAKKALVVQPELSKPHNFLKTPVMNAKHKHQIAKKNSEVAWKSIGAQQPTSTMGLPLLTDILVASRRKTYAAQPIVISC